jgi:hypothetical protein
LALWTIPACWLHPLSLAIRFWLLGFALFVLVPIVTAVCWFGVPIGTADITVDTSAVDGPVNVTVGNPGTLDDPNT